MINIKYNGTLGNKMFQYSLGRIIAEELGLKLNATIGEFEGTKNILDGKIGTSSRSTISGHKINLEEILNNKGIRGINLDGYFQRYEYYSKHKEKIKEWFKLEEKPKIQAGDNDLVLSIRRGWNGYPVDACPKFECFENIIKSNNYDKIIICTDSFDDEYFKQFLKYEPQFAKFSGIEQYNIINKANNIVITPSTFSWWAAWLSDAKDIYVPNVAWVTKDKTNSEYREDLDWFIEESRFINIDNKGNKI